MKLHGGDALGRRTHFAVGPRPGKTAASANRGESQDGSTVRYEGMFLVEVLRRAGVPFDKHLRGPRVANHGLVGPTE
jgi:hypothetical protein